MECFDKDLQSIQETRNLIAAAKKAYEKLAVMSQSDIDRIVAAISDAAYESAQMLAEAACEETGFGRAADKTIKNEFAAATLYEAIKNEKTVGIIAEDHSKKTIDIGIGVGVIAALVPSTNPTSTVIYKTMIAIKSGNAIVFSPHPGAKNCILKAVGIVAAAAEKAGCPKGAISAISIPTLEATNTLMRHEDVSLILATGGAAMVKAAYSSGTPAIGVGAGNGPAYIDQSADVDLAVRRIIHSKDFDYGTICASEQSIVITKAMEAKVTESLKKQGAYLMEPGESKKLGKFILRANFTMNPAIVGKSVDKLCEMSGLNGVQKGTKVLVARETGVGMEAVYSHEKLAPILALFVEADENACLKRCVEILNFEGAGHTFAIHSENEAQVKAFASAVPASRILVNTSASLGGVGGTTNLFPALTLGCGAVGGSSSSNNIGPLDLINIKRVAFGIKEIEDIRSASRKNLSGKSSDIDRMTSEIVGKIVSRVLKQLNM